MTYDPKTTKYNYPKDTAAHYLVIKKNRNISFDKNYDFVNKSKLFRFKRFFVRLLLTLIVFPFTRINMGLKIYGKKNLKKNKELIKGGILSCSNHIHMWDYIGIMKAIRPIKPYTLVWDKNVNGENGSLVRLVGGIPIPNNLPGKIKFNRTIIDLINNGSWIHVYAEGSMWEYYKPIRPFKSGISSIACRLNKPVIPMAFSYRKPNWFRKNILRQIACITLNIGEPLFKNPELDKNKQVDDLLIRLHKEVCRLAYIEDGKNIYNPIYQNSERIDY